MQSFLFLLLTSCVHAQFIQRWSWQNAQNAQGAWVPTPFWRPTHNDAFEPVLVPPGNLVLQYNCFRMPAICQNVANWKNDASKSQWTGQWTGQYDGQPTDYFTYDVGAGKSAKGRGQRRRRVMCPDTWKGTLLNPRCPEANQPQVVPPLWDANRNPVTALAPQSGTSLEVYLKIADGRDNRDQGQIQDSGRAYSCDEFPPASWVEGGGGYTAQTVPEGNGGAGTTYCAPIGYKCAGEGDVRGSEQNWQGFVHLYLGAHLEALAVQADIDVVEDSGIAFQFQRVNSQNDLWAARVIWTENGNQKWEPTHPGTTWRRRRENEKPSRVAVNFVPMGNGSISIELPNGENFRTYDGKTARQAAKRAVDLTFGMVTTQLDAETDADNTSSQVNNTDVVDWNITAADVDPTLTTSRHQTQQEPVDAIDIIELSKQYILAQIGANSTTDNSTFVNATSIPSHNRIRHAKKHASPRKHALGKRVDGPIQCGPNQPCLDGSCCSKLGKCGYKEAQCGPDNCLSNCDAKAMCGIDSADGKSPCGLKLCCSYYGWCGTEDVHCKDPEPTIGKTPCQQGYGLCEIKPSPSCGKGSGTSQGRRIAYYQGWNTRERACDKVYPRQINTRGLSHLLYAFAFFHPQTFEMMPMNAGDPALYGEFTALKRNGLQTWIAIGGWSFNDPGTATYNAYSDMVSTQANRRAFIQSLIKFMDTYGFQGADIDWEYPAEPKRGGRKEDTDNLVLLMKEMKEQFGGRYGSSLTIAPDYWYLRGFKPAAMQDFVDWIGFMAYDLHGPWDTDVKTLGSVVRPQTDITEIDKNLKPLWFDGVNPAKIVMGIAYYGRTYTLSNPSCGSMGCSFVPGLGGAAGSCTNSAGVLSNREIKRIIKDEGITPFLNTTAMVKYFTYQGSSWVGYDDAETYALKEAFANDRCLGGIMIWSIDFDDETGFGVGDGNDYISPESATIIPMAHTTVPAGQTFTVGNGAATDIPRLPNGGNQNTPQGPSNCQQCSFFRLITSTCCGNGGSVGNPVLIPAGVATPMDIPLPPGFVPPQSFRDLDGNIIPANQPLPRETIIPQGTIFTQPFVIGPGSSLRQGEGDDQNSNSSNLVWLSPEIWETPNPQVQCFFPCTFVLPPYPSYTTTIDYPRITVSESGTIKTTLTFPPLTVSRWDPTTVVVGGRSSCTSTNTAASCTETDQNHRTSTVQLSRSTTWPPVTWTESGTRRTTRPPEASRTTNPNPDPTKPPGGDDDDPGCKFPFICPPPPPPIRLPDLTINWGAPKPTTTPCAWPTLTCLPPGTQPSTIPGGGNPNDPVGPVPVPVEEDPEDEEEEEELCLLSKPKATKTVGVTVTATSTSTTVVVPTTTTKPAPPPPKKTPDFSKDEVKCYDSGQWTARARMVNAADAYCERSLKGTTLWEEWNPGELKSRFSRDADEITAVEIISYVEAKDGCEWKVDVNQCKAEMRKIIDRCDTNGENRKQGGRIVGDCLNWRLDPNSDL